MQVRDSGWIELAGKRRPCVVLDVDADLVQVIYGTSEERTYPCVSVHSDSRAGRAFPLSTEYDTTYFYGSNVAWTPRRGFESGKKPVSLDLLEELRKLVNQYRATITPG